MKTSEFLSKARELIFNGWTKEFYARNSLGQCVDYIAPNATCFCAEGALRRVHYDNDDIGAYYEARRYLYDVIGHEIHVWNDEQSDKMVVVDTFTKAIEKAEQKEAQA